MRSQPAVRLGVLVPQIVHRPPAVHSLAAAEEAIELAEAYGICRGHPLDESQQFTLQVGLGEREDGSWSATTVGDFEARQNGKNDTCAARELAGLLLFDEQLILHTAHEFKTANESFLRMVAVFQGNPDLRRMARIRYANGEQSIELRSGQRLKYLARTGGGGRGFAEADLIVYDEAQHLQPEHLAASGPARLANPNSQGWYMGSGGLSTSQVAWRMRLRALRGNGGRLGYVEHTAERITLVMVDGKERVVSTRPDVLDRQGWAEGNAAYGRRISDEALLGLLEEMGPELFARECMCMWDPEPGREAGGWKIVTEETWASCRETTHQTSGVLGWGLAVGTESRTAAIGVSDGVHLEVVAHGTGTGWAAGWLAERSIGEVWIAPTGPSGSVIEDLDAIGVRHHDVPLQDQAAGLGALVEDVNDLRSRHIGQIALDDAMRGAVTRTIGDVQVLSRSRSTTDSAPLEAVMLARLAAKAGAYEGPLVAVT